MTSTRDLTLRATRTFEPPYDDAARSEAVTVGSLALALSISRPSEQAPSLRLVDGGGLDEEDDGPFDGRRTPRAELPPPRAFGARLVQALSEATAGERPLAQLSPYFSHAVYSRLERHFAATVRDVTPGARANVRSVHVFEPVDGVAELAAVIRRGARVAAVALRLEGVDGRWQCTALQMV